MRNPRPVLTTLGALAIGVVAGTIVAVAYHFLVWLLSNEPEDY